jgi:CrcB protein
MLRYWLSDLTQQAVPSTTFPLGTLTVNVIGCFTIGLLIELAERRAVLTPETHALLVVGFLGGFTTFSAFANDTFMAYRGGAPVVAAANVAGSVLLCLIAIWLGRAAGAIGR